MMKIGRKFFLIVLLGFAAFSALAGFSLLEQRQAILDAYTARNRSVIGLTLSLLRQFEVRRLAGEMDMAAAQKAAKDLLRNVRYDHGDYVFVSDLNGKILMHPSRPELEAPGEPGLHDDDGRDLSTQLAAIGKAGDGTLRYAYTRIDGGRPLEKMSYVAHFEPWGWLIGTGVYLQDAEESFNAAVLRFAYSALPMGGLLLAAMAYLVRGITVPLKDLSAALELIGKRRFDSAVPHQERSDELGDLARGLEELRRLENVEAEVNRSRDLVAKVFDVAQEAVLITDTAGKIIQAGAAMCRMSGYDHADLIGKNASVLNSGHHDKAFFAEMWESVEKHDSWSGDVWNRRANGEIFVVRQHISAVRNENGEMLYYVAVMRDVGEKLSRLTSNRYLPQHDPLTNLSDCSLFLKLMDKILAATARSGGSLAVLLLDVDHFAHVNEDFGMVAGDEVLQYISLRLLKTVRASDSVARVGTDSFAVMMVEFDGEDELHAAASRLIEVMRHPIILGGRQVVVTMSVGIAVAGPEIRSGEALLAHAAQLATEAGAQGGNRMVMGWTPGFIAP